MIQFSGVYEITGVRKADGTEVSEDLKHTAKSRYFLPPYEGDQWRGLSAGSGSAAGSSSQFKSIVNGDQCFIAIDDEKGDHGSQLNKKLNNIRGNGIPFIKNAHMYAGIRHLDRWYSGIRHSLYGKLAHSNLTKKTFKDAEKAELVVATSMKNLFEEQVDAVKISPLSR